MKRTCGRAAAAFLAAAVLFLIPVQAAEPAVCAKQAVVLDAASGRILLNHSGQMQARPASTTKIMTALLVIEQCSLTELVTVPAAAVQVEGSSMGLKAGERCTVEQLLYGLLLHSGNDAAVALAIHHSGSVAAFARAMNCRAAELGLTNTRFVNPHGLDAEGHYASALDLARLAAVAMENPVFAKIVASRTATVDGRSFTNHNRLLWQYPGVVGVKTGYTRSAGRILVSAAQRDGRLLVAVTMDDPDDWRDHGRLLDYGFSAYEQNTLARSGQLMGNVPVLGGAAAAEAVLHETVQMPLRPDEQVKLQVALPPVVFAPVLAGDQAGTVTILLNDKKWRTYPLYWRKTVWEGV